MLRVVIFTFLICGTLGASHIFVIPAAAQPESDTLHYISDVLVINIRDQVEKPNTVVGIVRTGDPVHVLEEQNNYVKIETADKKQGWLAKQYIKKEAPEAVFVKQLREEVADLQKQLANKPAGEATNGAEKGKEQAESCEALQQKLNDAEKHILQLQEQQKRQSSAAKASADTGQGQEQNKELNAQLEETSQRYNQLIAEYEKRGEEIAALQNSIAKHDDTTRFLWFGAGAVVFFLGILAGRTANRKKNKFLY